MMQAMFRAAVLTVFLLVPAAGTAAAEEGVIFRWLDEQGQVVYSDEPPPAGGHEVEIIRRDPRRAYEDAPGEFSDVRPKGELAPAPLVAAPPPAAPQVPEPVREVLSPLKALVAQVTTMVWRMGAAVIAAMLFLFGLRLVFRARIKGVLGERRVAQIVAASGWPALYDVLLPDGMGGLMQIDHLVRTPGGVLLVETRDVPGLIIGEADDDWWTQTLGRRSFSFRNPLRESRAHRAAAKQFAGIVPVWGAVVFTGGGRFPNGVPEGASLPGDLQAILARAATSPTDAEQLDAAWSALGAAARTDDETRRAILAASEAHRDPRARIGYALIAIATAIAAALLLAG